MVNLDSDILKGEIVNDADKLQRLLINLKHQSIRKVEHMNTGGHVVLIVQVVHEAATRVKLLTADA